MLKPFPKTLIARIRFLASDERMGIKRSSEILGLSVGTLHRYCKKHEIEWKHRRKEYKPGMIVGRLTILERSPSQKGHNLQWKCECICGKHIHRSTNYFRDNLVPNCGCYKKEKAKQTLLNHVYRYYKKGARDRKLAFEITQKEIIDLGQLNCFYCGTPPSIYKWQMGHGFKTYKMNGIDRLDSSKGYVHGNIVPCCKRCNWCKRSYHINDFKLWIKRVHDNIFK